MVNHQRYDGKVKAPERGDGERVLAALAAAGELDENKAIEVLRSPYCTIEVAERIARSHKLTATHRVSELLCTIRGMPTARVHTLVSTLPWSSLLRLSQAPQAPPGARRLAERRLILNIPTMSLGERVSLARRAHRALFKHLIASGGDSKVSLALLENFRMTEDDVVILLGSAGLSADIVGAINRSARWTCRRTVRMAIARCVGAPLPLALSALAELGPGELRQLIADPRVPNAVREGAKSLLERRRDQKEKKMLR